MRARGDTVDVRKWCFLVTRDAPANTRLHERHYTAAAIPCHCLPRSAKYKETGTGLAATRRLCAAEREDATRAPLRKASASRLTTSSITTASLTRGHSSVSAPEDHHTPSEPASVPHELILLS